ncbi:MAG TPA: nuclear transport factor 2 family protein [Drouetiella sp.]
MSEAEDKILIQELTARYASALDSGAKERWLETWADMGVWDGDKRYEGRENLGKLYDDLGDRIKNRRHVVTNFVIDVEQDTAEQTCYLLIFCRHTYQLLQTGVYSDKLQRAGRHWHFMYRKLQFDGPQTKNQEKNAADTATADAVNPKSATT